MNPFYVGATEIPAKMHWRLLRIHVQSQPDRRNSPSPLLKNQVEKDGTTKVRITKCVVLFRTMFYHNSKSLVHSPDEDVKIIREAMVVGR